MACDQVIDSYEGTDDTGAYYGDIGYYIGQALTMGGTDRDICAAKFNVAVENTGGVSIDVAAKIYACTGTPGTDGMITGSALATSNTIQFTSTSTAWITFTFSTSYTLSASTNYCIVLECIAVVGNMIIAPTMDTSAPSHGGNTCLNVIGLDDYEVANDTNFVMYYGVGWSGKINNVEPGKVNGIAITNIGKITGV